MLSFPLVVSGNLRAAGVRPHDEARDCIDEAVMGPVVSLNFLIGTVEDLAFLSGVAADGGLADGTLARDALYVSAFAQSCQRIGG
jgi:hypothetical protein